MKIVFMGTPDFAKESLEAVYNSKHKVLAVVTNQDKPQGRGMKLTYSPVKKFAIEKNISIYQPKKVKENNEFIETLKKLNPDVICVVAYGKILPKEILQIPKFGCVNVHGSLLPKYRGAAPIQWAVLNGDKKTGITTMYMDEGMDTGDIIYTEEIPIGENETTGELWEKMEKSGGKLLVKTLDAIESGNAPRKKQTGKFSMAPMLNKGMAKIDWDKQDAIHIKNLVRGLNPIMGAYSFLNDKKIKFWKVDLIDENTFLEKYKYYENQEKFQNSKNQKNQESNDLENCKNQKNQDCNDLENYKKLRIQNINDLEKIKNGTVLLANEKKGLYIKTKKGILNVIEIQGENARRMSINDFLRGNHIHEFECFN